MELKQGKGGLNSYTWHGLTYGKLLAILNALQDHEADGRLTVVQQDVLIFLQRFTLENPFK